MLDENQVDLQEIVEYLPEEQREKVKAYAEAFQKTIPEKKEELALFLLGVIPLVMQLENKEEEDAR